MVVNGPQPKLPFMFRGLGNPQFKSLWHSSRLALVALELRAWLTLAPPHRPLLLCSVALAPWSCLTWLPRSSIHSKNKR